jgi:hypothetical protein
VARPADSQEETKSEEASGQDGDDELVTVQLERSVAESLLVALTRAIGGQDTRSGRG